MRKKLSEKKYSRTVQFLRNGQNIPERENRGMTKWQAGRAA
jgi:hypothetical protein